MGQYHWKAPVTPAPSAQPIPTPWLTISNSNNKFILRLHLSNLRPPATPCCGHNRNNLVQPSAVHEQRETPSAPSHQVYTVVPPPNLIRVPEYVQAISIEDVMAALEKHSSRNSVPGIIFTDNGTQLAALTSTSFTPRSLEN